MKTDKVVENMLILNINFKSLYKKVSVVCRPKLTKLSLLSFAMVSDIHLIHFRFPGGTAANPGQGTGGEQQSNFQDEADDLYS